jgi:hypothetical protein
MLGHDKTGVCSLIGETVDLVEKMRSPRYIKSYLPKELLPKQLETVKPKVRMHNKRKIKVYLARETPLC